MKLLIKLLINLSMKSMKLLVKFMSTRRAGRSSDGTGGYLASTEFLALDADGWCRGPPLLQPRASAVAAELRPGTSRRSGKSEGRKFGGRKFEGWKSEGKPR